jgi:hypothetical protein
MGGDPPYNWRECVKLFIHFGTVYGMLFFVPWCNHLYRKKGYGVRILTRITLFSTYGWSTVIWFCHVYDLHIELDTQEWRGISLQCSKRTFFDGNDSATRYLTHISSKPILLFTSLHLFQRIENIELLWPLWPVSTKSIGRKKYNDANIPLSADNVLW